MVPGGPPPFLGGQGSSPLLAEWALVAPPQRTPLTTTPSPLGHKPPVSHGPVALQVQQLGVAKAVAVTTGSPASSQASSGSTGHWLLAWPPSSASSYGPVSGASTWVPACATPTRSPAVTAATSVGLAGNGGTQSGGMATSNSPHSCSSSSAATSSSAGTLAPSASAMRSEKQKERKEKDKISLMKRLTAKRRSRSPPPPNFSCDNPSFVDSSAAAGQSSLQPPSAVPVVHISSPGPSIKKKRRQFSLKEKVDILTELNAGKKQVDICREHDIAPSTVATILNDREKIGARQHGVPLSGPIIQEKARHFAVALGNSGFDANCDDEAELDPELWNELAEKFPVDAAVTFEDYVDSDCAVATSAELTCEEIKTRSYLRCCKDVPEDILRKAADVEAYMHQRLLSTRQKKITDFFKQSGSCPSEVLGSQQALHKKTSSLDGNDSLKARPKQPAPLVRERFRCIVPYPPNSEYELELKQGDVVYVHKKREDGWFKGTLQRTGKTGLFPGSFVESF
ncbi:hypothetical protein HPB52_011716 [Rhipicephalus sanguineus]|uniref:RING-type E3 ubiquitin transferase n=1 Tax=Rhipicephalus sanguineus TaxID=34632 RepID=A0A9D4T3I2_RHISA|nr:hypothetical protein HPB52_011716 [Rhipicephalus sanguineus]